MRKVKILQQTIDDLTIALQRTNQRVDSLVTSVEALEARVKVLEILKEMCGTRMEKLGNELDVLKAELDAETVSNTSALLQEGIDSIMGYQWPPAKGDKS